MLSTLRTIMHIPKLNFYRAFSKGTTNQPSSPKTSAPAIKSEVPGLSANIVKKRCEPLGPGASPSGVYKVPEYFCYDQSSYYEAEVELAKYRCPQPSAVKQD